MYSTNANQYAKFTPLEALENIKVLKANFNNLGAFDVFRQIDSTIARIEKMNLFERLNFALDKTANSNMKVNPYLTPNEILRIKEAILAYSSEEVYEKEIIISCLNVFERQIRENYVLKTRNYQRKKLYSECQVKILEGEKFKIIFERVSAVKWPYSKETKILDAKIKAFEEQAKVYDSRLKAHLQTVPVADEKEILKFKLALQKRLTELKSRVQTA